VSEVSASRRLASAGDEPPQSFKPPTVSRLRRVLPFVIAALLLVLVFARIDFRAFWSTLARVNGWLLFGWALLWQLVLLAADALGNFVVYRRTAPSVGYRDFYVFRGASYLPGMVNHHLGQAYMTYLQAKLLGIPVARMAGTTLVSYAGWFGCLLGCMTVALPFADLPPSYVWLGTLGVPVVLVSGVVYLVLVSRPPAALASSTLLAPLFEAGFWGHLRALVGRLPHLAVLVVGTWVAYRIFAIPIPLATALVYLPIILVLVTLPITPQGFGAREAAAITFFSSFAPGDSDAARAGALTAASTAWGVSITLVAVGLGVTCTRLLARRSA
jgi:hypothetical protein